MEPAEPEDPEEPEEPEGPDVPGDWDRPDDGEPDGLVDGDAVGRGVDPGGADPDADGVDPVGADVLGWVGELGANCVQAAMITRPLAGSALPPTSLRSTK